MVSRSAEFCFVFFWVLSRQLPPSNFTIFSPSSRHRLAIVSPSSHHRLTIVITTDLQHHQPSTTSTQHNSTIRKVSDKTCCCSLSFSFPFSHMPVLAKTMTVCVHDTDTSLLLETHGDDSLQQKGDKCEESIDSRERPQPS